jgi:hypothetical protein
MVELISQPRFEALSPSVLPVNSAVLVTLHGKNFSDDSFMWLRVMGQRIPLLFISPEQGVFRIDSSLERNVTCVVGIEFGDQFLSLHHFVVFFRRPTLVGVELNMQNSVFSVGGVVYFDVIRGSNDNFSNCQCIFMTITFRANVFKFRIFFDLSMSFFVESFDLLLLKKTQMNTYNMIMMKINK